MTAYKDYGDATSFASANPQVTATCFGGGGSVNGWSCIDDGYHTYALWQRNATRTSYHLELQQRQRLCLWPAGQRD